ncbi:hypothetical protein [Jatrophihabitans endophyticus]|uniref:hypothetical protein n=1 Tax=Jatrophihabitans endophyticus TaxID=1206085 RepID=UPI0019DD9EEB|nr:hypothetical protein [Jatrophihabitans endophyticus]MBE7186989.1 hypothetical protein [Jatrophihabitans endophyticus]
MTTSDWIIDIVLVLIVLRQIREEKLTLRFVLVPLGIVAYVAHTYLTSFPTAGNDLVLTGAALALGSALGVAGGLLTKVRGVDGAAFVRAGWGAASLWVASMSARLGFIIWITHSGGAALGRFSVAHDITSADVWQTALVVLALSEVLTRVGTIVLRGHRAADRSRRPEVTDARPLVTV